VRILAIGTGAGKIPDTRHEFHVSGGHQPGDLGLAFEWRNENQRRRNRDVPQNIFQRYVANRFGVQKNHFDCRVGGHLAKVLKARSNYEPCRPGNAFQCLDHALRHIRVGDAQQRNAFDGKP
jgi:hypothetical protein